MDAMIRVNDVSMMFNMSSDRIDNIKEYIIRLLKKQLMFQEFWALKHISFELEKGDSLFSKCNNLFIFTVHIFF